MSVHRSSRSLLAGAALVAVLTACGAAAPPAKELADELIDTLEVSDAVKDCMHDEVEGFTLTEEEAQGFDDLDDVAAKAADGQARAQVIIDRFQAALASCNTAG